MDYNDYLFKVILVGNSGVGKTCIASQFAKGWFPTEQTPTIGVDFLTKTIQFGDDTVKLQLWDTAGQERFQSITQSYYRSAQAILIVYDVTCQPSFDAVQRWLQEISRNTDGSSLLYLVGNKSDCGGGGVGDTGSTRCREVPRNIGEEYALRHRLSFHETSASRDVNGVNDLFGDVARRLLDEAMENAAMLASNYSATSSSGSPPGGATGRRDKLALEGQSGVTKSCCG